MSEDRIESNPAVMLGKPVVRGTRVTVELLLRKLSEGASEDDLLDAYPRITREDLRAAVGFAAETLVDLAAEHGHRLAGSFVVVTPAHVRFRPMPG